MCPACMSAVTMVVVGATSTGGLAALVARMVRARSARPSEASRESTVGAALPRSPQGEKSPS